MNNATVKSLGIVVIGVLIAGFVMFKLKDISIVSDAQKGYA